MLVKCYSYTLAVKHLAPVYRDHMLVTSLFLCERSLVAGISFFFFGVMGGGGDGSIVKEDMYAART